MALYIYKNFQLFCWNVETQLIFVYWTLYSTVLLNSLIKSSSFFCRFCGVFYVDHHVPGIKTVLFLCCNVYLLFIFQTLLHWLWLSSIMVQIENIRSFAIKYDANCIYLNITIYQFSFHCIPGLLRGFKIMNRCWICQILFLYLLRLS